MATSFQSAFAALITKINGNFVWIKNQITSINSAVSGKASASDLTTHTGDTTVHITSTERDTWNGKQNALSSTQLANIADIPNKADASAIPTKVSDLTNDANFATLTQVNSLVAGKITKQTVDSLPAVADALDNVIYLVPNGETSGSNVKDEYMLINGALEKIGSTNVDLSGYYAISALDSDLTSMFNAGTSNITDLTE